MSDWPGRRNIGLQGDVKPSQTDADKGDSEMPHPVFKAMFAGTALAFALPAFAQGARASSPTEFVHMAERIKPGEWVWAPGVAPHGQVVVYVDLSRQLATVYRNGVRIGVSSVSSGKPGHETPTGVFTILQKDAQHRSSKYSLLSATNFGHLS